MYDLLLPCPFCNHPVDITDFDTLYPTGTVWKNTPRGRSYHRHGSVSDFDGRCWSMNCTESAGGCGAEVVGDSMAQAIEKWQTRVNFDYTSKW